MIHRIQSMSFPRTLTFAVSLAGLAVLAVLWWRIGSDYAEQTARNYILLSLPFVFAAIVSLAPMSTKARIAYLWMISAFAGTAAVLTIFGGVGYFYLLALIAYLWSAWALNESGE